MEDVPTVGDTLLEHGYETALIGKSHLQPLKSTDEYPSLDAYPILHDFKFWKEYKERFYGFKDIALVRNHTIEAHVGQHYVLWLEEKGYHDWKDYFLEPTGKMDKTHFQRIENLAGSRPRGFIDAVRNWGTWDIPEEYHYNTWIAEHSNKLIEQYVEDDKPFLLWASFPDPHPEYFVPKPWDTMYNPADMIVPGSHNEDHKNNPPHFQLTQEEAPDFSEFEIGWELEGTHSHLQKPEELQKDIALYYGMVSFTDKYIGKILDKLDELGIRDNTIVVFTSDHGHFLGQHGLIRKGPFHYEDVIKVPMIVSHPNHIAQNEVSETLQSLVDFTPTFLAAADIPIPHYMTGKNQLDVWNGKVESVRSCIICENTHEHPTMNLRTYVDERYKITIYNERTYGELFDLQEDPGEINNLWDNKQYQQLKMDLLLKYCSAELDKESRPMPRIIWA